MCLTTIDPKPTCRYGTGYKIFRYYNNRHLVAIFAHGGSVKRFKVDHWLTDTNEKAIPFIRCGIADYYPAGFHIYASKKDAIANKGFFLVIRKVRFRKVVATGTQDGVFLRSHKVIVAGEIFIYKKKRGENDGI